MSRQIRIDGKVVKLSREQSIEYFSKRPLKSRISAYVSDQSKVIKNKEVTLKI
jgi:pyridoxamine 5'-phosphate oxidase